MPKAQAKQRNDAPDIDATPQRIAHAEMRAQAIGNGGHGHMLVDVVDMSGASQRKLGKHRRFKDSRLDRLYMGHTPCITWAQWYAGDWWRNVSQDAIGSPRLVADYGQSTGRGSGDPSPLPLSDKAEAARARLHAARRALTLDQRIAVEDLVIETEHEPMTGRRAEARLHWWRNGLQALAVHLEVAK